MTYLTCPFTYGFIEFHTILVVLPPLLAIGHIVAELGRNLLLRATFA